MKKRRIFAIFGYVLKPMLIALVLLFQQNVWAYDANGVPTRTEWLNALGSYSSTNPSSSRKCGKDDECPRDLWHNDSAFCMKLSGASTNGYKLQHFQVGLSAAGKFTLNWGDGYIEDIDRTDNTTFKVYTHEYKKESGVKAANIDGYSLTSDGNNIKTVHFCIYGKDFAAPTAYNSLSSAVVLSSWNDKTVKLPFPTVSFSRYLGGTGTEYDFVIEGLGYSTSLFNVFPHISGGSNNPAFTGTFLATQFYGSSVCAFERNDTSVGSRIGQFAFTFAGVQGGAVNGCGISIGSSSAPANSQRNLFTGTFAGFTGSITLWSEMFGHLYGSVEKSMFENTFAGSGVYGLIPTNLFSGVSGDVSTDAFSRTFKNCSHLGAASTSSTSSVINNYVRAEAFENFTAVGSVDMENIFWGTALPSTCPAGVGRVAVNGDTYWTTFVTLTTTYKAIACKPCAVGYYKSDVSAAACQQCTAGYKTNVSTTGATDCTACPAGQWSYAGSATCTNCPAGTYNSHVGGVKNDCLACSSGEYSPAGATECTKCPALYPLGSGVKKATELEADCHVIMSFNSNGGTSVANRTIDNPRTNTGTGYTRTMFKIGNLPSGKNTLPSPTKSSSTTETTYVFDAWYKSSSFITASKVSTTTEFTSSDVSSSGYINLYARWKVKCGAGYYLPANKEVCSSCPTNRYCPGNVEYFKSTIDQGITSCSSGTSGSFTYSSSNQSSVISCYAKLTYKGNGGATSNAEKDYTVHAYNNPNLGSTSCYYPVGSSGSGGTSTCISPKTAATSSTAGTYVLRSNAANNGVPFSSTYYTFDGWYKEPGLTNKVTDSTSLSGDNTLWAKWNPYTYPIIYHTNGGNCTASATGNLISAHPEKTWTTNNGITVKTYGNGVYDINGTATGEYALVTIPVNEFIMPASVGQGGTGSIAVNNSYVAPAGVLFRIGNRTDGVLTGYQLNAADVFSSVYNIGTNEQVLAGKTINKIDFYVQGGKTLDHLIVAPAIYNDGRTSAGVFRVDSRCTLNSNICVAENDCQPVVYKPTEDTTLATPTKSLYKFVGWYADENFGGSGVTSILANTTTGAKNYYAKWRYRIYYGDNTADANSQSYPQESGKQVTPKTFAQSGLTIPGNLTFVTWSVNDSSCSSSHKLKSGVGICDTNDCATCTTMSNCSSGDYYLATPNSNGNVWLHACYTLHCDAGKYADVGDTTCEKTCPAGSYCPGGDFNYNKNTTIGLNTCPTGYTSDEGAIIENDCYVGGTVACSVANPVTDAHGSVTYEYSDDGYANCRTYYGSNTCALVEPRDCTAKLTCDSEYTKELGYSPLNTDYVSLTPSSYTSVPLSSTSADAGTWTATFSDGSIITGDSVCSTTRSNYWSALLDIYASTVVSKSVGGCWCRVTSFTPSGGPTQTYNSWYAYRGAYSSGTLCLNNCADWCSKLSTVYNRQILYKTPEYCAETAYTITYNVLKNNDDTWTTESLNPSTYGITSSGNLPSSISATRSGYRFDGWCLQDSYANPNCTTVATLAELQADLKNYDLYAKWTPEVYDIKYYTIKDNNIWTQDTTLTPSTYTVLSSGSLPTSITVTRQNYEFLGWCMDEDSYNNPNCTLVTFEDLKDDPQNHNLYAKWGLVIYEFDLRKNANDAVDGSRTKLYEKYTVGWFKEATATTQITQNTNGLSAAELPTRSGYDFNGFYKCAAATGNNCEQIITNTGYLSSSAVANVANNGELFADWAVAEYTITYNVLKNSDNTWTTESLNPSTYGITSSGALPSSINTQRSGYSFEGWCLEDSYANPNCTLVTLADLKLPPQNQTLYARWHLDEYTITYNVLPDGIWMNIPLHIMYYQMVWVVGPQMPQQNQVH